MTTPPLQHLKFALEARRRSEQRVDAEVESLERAGRRPSSAQLAANADAFQAAREGRKEAEVQTAREAHKAKVAALAAREAHKAKVAAREAHKAKVAAREAHKAKVAALADQHGKTWRRLLARISVEIEINSYLIAPPSRLKVVIKDWEETAAHIRVNQERSGGRHDDRLREVVSAVLRHYIVEGVKPPPCGPLQCGGQAIDYCLHLPVGYKMPQPFSPSDGWVDAQREDQGLWSLTRPPDREPTSKELHRLEKRLATVGIGL